MTEASRSAITQVAAPTRASRRRTSAELFLISFVILFFELACIRWFGSTVVFLTFFTNLTLMACFLGTSVGCLAASRSRDFVQAVIPLALLAALLASGVLHAYETYRNLAVDVGGQASPQQIFFGTEARPVDASRFVVPIEAIAGVFFVLIALTFVGLGQVMGRRFNALPNRVLAYTTDIGGSLTGIATFGLASWLRLPPVVWFAVGLSPVLLFVRRWRVFHIIGLVGLLAFLGARDLIQNEPGVLTWSPYYKVRYNPGLKVIYVNNIGHQDMCDVQAKGLSYLLPHLLNRDAGGRPFEDVLIIGAGSGNDVAAALMAGAKHVDAVEIDPVLNEIGRRDHPNHPFRDPRVTVTLDDGRDFVHRAGRKYDLIIYALVDSLVLHSGYSSLRLESFLFTEQAMRDVKARLKPGGVFAMYNIYRQGWVVGRLEAMAEKVFGTRPLVCALPYRERITPATALGMGITFILVGNTEATAVDRIRRAMENRRAFWANQRPALNLGVNAYRAEPPFPWSVKDEEWQRIAPAAVQTSGIGWTPTDDWPFLYLRDATIPRVNLVGITVVGVLSLVILLVFAPNRARRPNGRMFFLGAGFMLLETKGVVHMALLFGSTWVVNSVVFFAVLVMIILANLYVMVFHPHRLGIAYGLLIASLLVNAAVPMTTFLALPGAWRAVGSCLVVFLPIFFAGVIFATSFRGSATPDVDFGSNIAGVILGGLSENLSLIVGFNHLLYLAILYYILSAVLGAKRRASEGDAAPLAGRAIDQDGAADRPLTQPVRETHGDPAEFLLRSA